jgi:hypothetical protein
MSRSIKMPRQVPTESTYARMASSVLQNALMLLKPGPLGDSKGDLTMLPWGASMRRTSNVSPSQYPARSSWGTTSLEDAEREISETRELCHDVERSDAHECHKLHR